MKVTHWTLSAAAALALALPATAPAQQQGQGRGRGGFGGALLAIPKVQEELKLTAEQKDKIKDVFAKLRDLAREERQAKTAEAVKTVTDSLTAEQKTRLKQLERQREFPGVLVRDEEVVTALKLTDDQKSKLKEIAEEIRPQRPAQGQGRPPFDREALAKLAEKRKEAVKKATDLLTDEQKKTWATLTGDKFEFPAFGGPGGGQTGGNRRRPNNNN
jgi:Spy/CpxP family protein refolding chaperone